MPPNPAVYQGGDAGLHAIATLINNTISQAARSETCILSVLENSEPVYEITAYQWRYSYHAWMYRHGYDTCIPGIKPFRAIICFQHVDFSQNYASRKGKVGCILF